MCSDILAVFYVLKPFMFTYYSRLTVLSDFFKTSYKWLGPPSCSSYKVSAKSTGYKPDKTRIENSLKNKIFYPRISASDIETLLFWRLSRPTVLSDFFKTSDKSLGPTSCPSLQISGKSAGYPADNSWKAAGYKTSDINFCSLFDSNLEGIWGNFALNYPQTITQLTNPSEILTQCWGKGCCPLCQFSSNLNKIGRL